MKKDHIKYLVLLLIVFLSFWYFSTKVQAPSGTSMVTFYVVADPETDPSELPPETVEVEGCGLEYLVPITEETPGEDDLSQALNKLFSIDQEIYPEDGYRNSTYMSSLFAIVEEDEAGRLIVNLEGSPLNAGHCDTPRFKGQIEKTVELYAGTQEYEIQVNGDAAEWRCLGDESGMCS